MKQYWKKILIYAVLLATAIYLLAILIPRTYDVSHAHPMQRAQYWELSTGSKIAYYYIPAKGQKKPFPILFLQGGPGGFISDRNISILASLADDGYDIYLYDQIGSGQSERLANITEYTANRHKADLEEIVEKIGSEKVILIGQSWGAVLATLFVADNHNRVEKIIYTGAASILPMREELLNMKAPDSLHLKKPPYTNREANEKCLNLRVKAIIFIAQTFGLKLASDNEMDDYQTYLNGELNKATVCDTSKALKASGGGGFYAHIMTVNSFVDIDNPRIKLKNCKVPILMLRGECDGQPWGFAIEYLELFPNHQLKIIPGAGHFITVEQPQLYLTTIRDFLNIE